jgi:Cof subfamily protein (haloacid dehalogenase superfamily)
MMAAMYKLLALDVDGTLVRADGTIGEADLRSIRALQEAGVTVTLITGRLYSGSRDVAAELGIRGPVACVDGSHIVHTVGDRDLLATTLRGADVARLRDLVPPTSARFAMFRGRIVHDDAGAEYADYVRSWSMALEAVEDIATHECWSDDDGISAFVAVGTHDEIREAAAAIQTSIGTARVSSFVVTRLVDRSAMVVRADGTDKGTALAWIAEHYGYQVSETVAVGDWLNDVPMFRRAARSFVMGHALDVVKSAATDRLACEHPGEGIAEAIERAFGIRAG